MDHLIEQVAIAQRRLSTNRFLSLLPSYLAVALSVAVLALAVPKLWTVSLPSGPWAWGWLGAATGVALLATVGATWWRRQGKLAAAVELDQRFRLKERISSALTLTEQELQTDAGRALLADAIRRAERLDVRQEFPVSFARRAWLPLIPAVAAFLLVVFVPDRAAKQQAAAATTPAAASEQAEQALEKLRKKLQNTRRELRKKNLENADGLFDKLEAAAQEKRQQENPLDRKRALVKLNDMASAAEKRREELAGSERLKERLGSLKNLSAGPAEKMSKALQAGNYKKAIDEIQKMQQQLAKGELDDKQREQLAKQLEEMQQKLAGMAEKHQAAMKQLEQQIEQARQAGDLQQASQLQQQLDKLANQMPQMNRLSQMAQQMSAASQQMRLGQPGQAAESLSELAASLEQVQQELDEMETLNGTLDDIADAKADLCEQCSGGG